MRLFPLEKRLWQSSGSSFKLSLDRPKDVLHEGQRPHQPTEEIHCITCLLTHWADYTPHGKVEVDLTIVIHPREESWVWTMAKEISSPLGELRREGKREKTLVQAEQGSEPHGWCS